MSSFYARDGAGDLLARYSFIEPLLDGKRVLELGAARATEGGSALFLAERGAAAVLSIEPAEDDLAAAREAGHHPFVQFRASDASELRAGAFDLVLVADGAALGRSPERLAALRRLLAVHDVGPAATCIHRDPIYGTRSSSVLRLAASLEASDLWTTDGRPCASPFDDQSRLLASLAASP